MSESTHSVPKSVWASGEAYQMYIGRWSEPVARKFLEWLDVPAQAAWLDVGCGTGALANTIRSVADPKSVKGIDASPGFIHYAQSKFTDAHLSFELGDARALPVESEAYDAVVSGLMLNFVPQPEQAVAEMARAAKPGALVAAYVWDYASRMQFMRHFWNQAAALDPAAQALDEGRLFPLTNPGPLSGLFSKQLQQVELTPLDIWMEFQDFDDFWRPFLGGQGPAPAYVMSLDEAARDQLRENLRAALPIAVDGSLSLIGRAWAVRGRR